MNSQWRLMSLCLSIHFKMALTKHGFPDLAASQHHDDYKNKKWMPIRWLAFIHLCLMKLFVQWNFPFSKKLYFCHNECWFHSWVKSWSKFTWFQINISFRIKFWIRNVRGIPFEIELKSLSEFQHLFIHTAYTFSN